MLEVQHASNDADAPIVFTALEKSQQKGPVTVVGEDTDLLMLLLCHYQIGIHSSVYLYSNATIRLVFTVQSTFTQMPAKQRGTLNKQNT